MPPVHIVIMNTRINTHQFINRFTEHHCAFISALSYVNYCLNVELKTKPLIYLFSNVKLHRRT